MFVEETLVEETLFETRVPAPVTRNWVEELTCKLMKSPLKPEAGLEPIKVPVVCASWMVLGPMTKRAELVEAGGEPERKSALSPVRVDWMYPVAVRFVEETEAREDWPVAFRVAAEIFPDAVMFVPEAFVKRRVGKRPEPDASMFVPEAEARVDWPETFRVDPIVT